MFAWDPQRYQEYADERGRPFVELLARVPAERPRSVVDLGCGPGTLTRWLSERWPGADVLGVDSSPEMVDRAEPADRLHFEVGDLTTWRADRPVDVLVSNAALQWVPGHLELLPDLLTQVAPGGWFAFSVPGNFGEPSHVVRRELAAEAPYAEHLAGLPEPDAHAATTYLRALRDLGAEVDAWETTYLHVLTGTDAVFRWISGTSARPMLEAVPEDLRGSFESELRSRLAAAYPARYGAVVLPFRRVFVVAHRPA